MNYEEKIRSLFPLFMELCRKWQDGQPLPAAIAKQLVQSLAMHRGPQNAMMAFQGLIQGSYLKWISPGQVSATEKYCRYVQQEFENAPDMLEKHKAFIDSQEVHAIEPKVPAEQTRWFNVDEGTLNEELEKAMRRGIAKAHFERNDREGDRGSQNYRWN